MQLARRKLVNFKRRHGAAPCNLLDPAWKVGWVSWALHWCCQEGCGLPFCRCLCMRAIQQHFTSCFSLMPAGRCVDCTWVWPVVVIAHAWPAAELVLHCCCASKPAAARCFLKDAIPAKRRVPHSVLFKIVPLGVCRSPSALLPGDPPCQGQAGRCWSSGASWAMSTPPGRWALAPSPCMQCTGTVCQHSWAALSQPGNLRQFPSPRGWPSPRQPP